MHVSSFDIAHHFRTQAVNLVDWQPGIDHGFPVTISQHWTCSSGELADSAFPAVSRPRRRWHPGLVLADIDKTGPVEVVPEVSVPDQLLPLFWGASDTRVAWAP
jgi:hypothetical protein